MKRPSHLVVGFLIVLSPLFYNSSIAQANWEVGMRFGNDIAADITIPLARVPRLHSAIYFDRFGLGEYFNWMFALSDGPTGLKFYPGVGPEFWFGSTFDVGVAGDFGAEYAFDFPLTVGFDWRPGFMITDSFRWHSGNWGFTARFRIGQGTKFVKTN